MMGSSISLHMFCLFVWDSVTVTIICDGKIEEITKLIFTPIFYLKWPRKICPKPFQIEDRFREQSP